MQCNAMIFTNTAWLEIYKIKTTKLALGFALRDISFGLIVTVFTVDIFYVIHMHRHHYGNVFNTQSQFETHVAFVNYFFFTEYIICIEAHSAPLLSELFLLSSRFSHECDGGHILTGVITISKAVELFCCQYCCKSSLKYIEPNSSTVQQRPLVVPNPGCPLKKCITSLFPITGGVKAALLTFCCCASCTVETIVRKKTRVAAEQHHFPRDSF